MSWKRVNQLNHSINCKTVVEGHVLLRRVFSLIQKSDQDYRIFGCFYWYTTQFAITDTALNYSLTNNVKRRWRRREN